MKFNKIVDILQNGVYYKFILYFVLKSYAGVKILRIKLKERRKEMGYTQESISEKLGISIRTYQNIEQGVRFPRQELLKKIMVTLKVTSMEYFDNLEPDQKKCNDGMVLECIRQFMNSSPTRKSFTFYEVSAINSAIMDYFLINKKRKKNMIGNRTRERKKIVNSQIAEMVNQRLNQSRRITGDDVLLFKRCKILEFNSRKHKCIWGFPLARKSLGFNPETGDEEV